jgi:putative sigma-54 modulation protein
VGQGKVKLEIDGSSVALNSRLRAHVQRRLEFALSGFGELVQGVTVRLSPADPQRGDGAKRCEIEVALRPRSVRAEDTDIDPFVAVDNAAARLQRSLGRALEHERGGLEGRLDGRPDGRPDGHPERHSEPPGPVARGRRAAGPKPPAKM